MSEPSIDIRVITTVEDWAQLQQQWDTLLQSVAEATALQSYSFLRCWWRHFGHDKRLRIIVASENGRLVGIAPLQLVRRRKYGKEYSVLEFISMPDELDRPCFLVTESKAHVLNPILDSLARLDDNWDLIQLDEIDTTSWQIEVAVAWARRLRLWCRTDSFHPVPFLVKKTDWNGFLDTKSRRFGKRLRYAERRLKRDHTLTYRWSHGPGEHLELLDQFFAIETRSWKATKGFDVGANVGYQDFYRELLGNDQPSLRGHIVVQYIDDQPSAATFGFSSNETYYSLQIAHDSRYDKYSPGTLLEAFEMQWFFENAALQRYELLGGEGMNKRRWTSAATDTSNLRIQRPSFRFAAANIYRFLRQLIRRSS